MLSLTVTFLISGIVLVCGVSVVLFRSRETEVDDIEPELY